MTVCCGFLSPSCLPAATLSPAPSAPLPSPLSLALPFYSLLSTNFPAALPLPGNPSLVEAKDFLGRTPLHSAATFGYIAAAGVLRAAGGEAGERRESAAGMTAGQMWPARARVTPARPEPPAPTGGWVGAGGREALEVEEARLLGLATAAVGGVGAVGGCEISVSGDPGTEMGPKEFLMGHLTAGQPVLLKSAAAGWPLIERWARAPFERTYGSR